MARYRCEELDMSKLLIVLLVSFSHSLLACAQDRNVSKSSAKKTDIQKQVPTQKVPESDHNAPIVRGVKLPENQKALNLDAIADQPENFSDKQVCVEGSISAVCQAKGCWMTMAGTKATSRARVTFKDYAFFVPKDVKGKKVKVLGEVKVKLLSEAERKHLAEDGRVDVSEIPKAELRLVASGVEIRP